MKTGILLLREKHGERAFDARTPEALHASALAIVKERNNERWYYPPTPPKLCEEVPDDVLERLPEAMRKKAKDDKHSNKRNQKRYERDLEKWNLLQKAIAEDNGEAAWKFLQDRRDHEYEGYTLLPLEPKVLSTEEQRHG